MSFAGIELINQLKMRIDSTGDVKMKTLAILVGLVSIVAQPVSAQAQFSGWDDDEPPMEEIVVIGKRQNNRGFAGFDSVLEYLDFRDAVDINWMNQLNEILNYANEASEQYCNSQIDNWLAQCHITVERANVGCLTLGLGGAMYVLRALGLLQNIAGLTAGNGTVLLGCTELREAAHADCEAIAASSRAPEIAGCPGHTPE